MFDRLREDINVAFQNDPAARSKFEVLLCYPGIHALWLHRIAHYLWRREWITVSRFISHINRFLTGIEIHPAAQIGRGVFIDHGMGVVIGETAVIGDGCLLYKGVVLGGTTTEKTKRHPNLGKKVIVGSNACILGNITIGDCARIGSGSVITKDVPPHATVVGVPGRIIKQRKKGEQEALLDHGQLPDPIAEAIMTVLKENGKLKQRIKKLENTLNLSSDADDAASETESEIMSIFMKNYKDGDGI
ncbi:MAG: serine O-acetyltransferase [Candidatus Brocadia sp.]|uniref:serine O-acetyltransferase n=1 Tax=Candidatus Brocadia fulgida TaxID=380242 RepID=A0A0M2UUF6_9BACT|nr:MAG: serine O-acetyltransferase [Candidatus Brocadia fulgida]MCC6326062.1 serine O-acetyltransferase [Candidatus Brocadia sp.]MCE7910739.1 serine O-acetyltransferase [Candidatus Brocadia sp. AMX3]MBV6518803.1 Serine acetyltransferase [Candidatus Brocadia fulgida]MDG5996283.1 serine O-acetyltransferase [Candidatus Brocadia sp.]